MVKDENGWQRKNEKYSSKKENRKQIAFEDITGKIITKMR